MLHQKVKNAHKKLRFWGSAGPPGAGIGVFQTFLAAEKPRAWQGYHWKSQVPSCPNKDFQPVQFWGGEGDYRSLLCKKTPPFFLKTLYFSIKPVQTGTEKNLILFGSSIKNKPPFLYGNAAPTVFANVQLLASNCSLKISQSSWSECN